jgi:hypothetical protein
LPQSEASLRRSWVTSPSQGRPINHTKSDLNHTKSWPALPSPVSGAWDVMPSKSNLDYPFLGFYFDVSVEFQTIVPVSVTDSHSSFSKSI